MSKNPVKKISNPNAYIESSAINIFGHQIGKTGVLAFNSSGELDEQEYQLHLTTIESAIYDVDKHLKALLEIIKSEKIK